MLFKYKAVDERGIKKEGEIDAPNRDLGISALQRRNLIVVSIIESEKKKSFLEISFFEKASNKDVVILSRQIATLFEAQVSALKAFSMLASNSENKFLAKRLIIVGEDLQAGMSVSGALSKHPEIFSQFYINMVKAGEETGKLNQTFLHLADYLDRQYAITSKTRNALIYPAFVVVTFFVVMGLMFTMVIPRLSGILKDSGQEIPVFTQIILSLSEFFVNYGIIFLIFIALFGVWIFQMSRTESGKNLIDKYRLSIPAIGNLYRKLYLSRISDNLDTMLVSGIPIIKSLDITSDVVNSNIYKSILKEVTVDVKAGLSLSQAFEKHPEYLPGIMVQMVKVGEETGSLGPILKTLGDFYKREVDDAVDTLIGLIEPVMIVVLGLGVGILLVAVLIPIYNIAGNIG